MWYDKQTWKDAFKITEIKDWDNFVKLIGSTMINRVQGLLFARKIKEAIENHGHYIPDQMLKYIIKRDGLDYISYAEEEREVYVDSCGNEIDPNDPDLLETFEAEKWYETLTEQQRKYVHTMGSCVAIG